MEERRASTQDASVIQLGDLFLNMADLFKVYTPYVINHPTAEAVIRELIETNKLFAEFLNVRSSIRKLIIGSHRPQHQQFNNTKTRGLTIFMFLSKPIQRICKYPLLLRVRSAPRDCFDQRPTLRRNFSNSLHHHILTLQISMPVHKRSRYGICSGAQRIVCLLVATGTGDLPEREEA